MKYMSREEYEKQLRIVKRNNVQKKYKQSLKQAKSSWKSPKRQIETSKKLAVYLFMVLNVVIIYSLIAMWHFSDLAYLGVLISDIAAQILLYGIYCLKAFKAKQSEEEMKYKKEKLKGVGELIEAGAESVTDDTITFNSMNGV